MSAVIDSVWRARLKGSWGEDPKYLLVDTTVGVLWDREMAVRRKPGNMREWAPKGVFHVCMNTPQMAKENPSFELTDDAKVQFEDEYLDGLKKRLGIDGELLLQKTDGSYSLHDTKGTHVSFINLATVDELSKFMNCVIDPRRFRMNVRIAGLPAFEELNWVDTYPGTKKITVGSIPFRVDDACERCKAIEANPATGAFDLELQDALVRMMTKRGYKSPHRGIPRVMGILAAPLENGLIGCGDEIKLLYDQ